MSNAGIYFIMKSSSLNRKWLIVRRSEKNSGIVGMTPKAPSKDSNQYWFYPTISLFFISSFNCFSSLAVNRWSIRRRWNWAANRKTLTPLSTNWSRKAKALLPNRRRTEASEEEEESLRPMFLPCRRLRQKSKVSFFDSPEIIANLFFAQFIDFRCYILRSILN